MWPDTPSPLVAGGHGIPIPHALPIPTPEVEALAAVGLDAAPADPCASAMLRTATAALATTSDGALGAETELARTRVAHREVGATPLA